MKLTKMSLAVAVLVASSSAFALDVKNVKVKGDANVFYSTTDIKTGYAGLTGKDDLFGKDNSAADASLNLMISADLEKNDYVKVSGAAAYTVISTLGLENNFVSNVWAGSHTATTGTGANYGAPLGGAKVENANWMTEAWIAVEFQKATKSTLKIGRMELDTPLAFTEKWSIEKNTFESAVLLNQDLPDTTIVAAWVGNGNGNEQFGEDAKGVLSDGTLPAGTTLAMAPVVNADGKFTTFGKNGAYAFGVVNNSWKPLKAQAWYYELPSFATAYWLQADFKNEEGILAGAQFTSGKVGNGDNSGTYAVMAGYEKKDVVTVKAAYSQTSDKGALHGANVATTTNYSKLYTEAWWNYGYVTKKDAHAYNVTVEGKAADVELGLYYTSAFAEKGPDLNTEVTLTAKKKFGPLEGTLAYVYTDADDQNNGDAYNIVQAYLTLKF